jgi:hypothetical protein
MSPGCIDRPMKGKNPRKGKVNAYSYTRIAGNYISIFSKPAKILIFIIIIILILMFGIIFLGSVIF